MEIKNFNDYMFRLDVVNDFLFVKNVSKEKYIQNFLEKLNDSDTISSELFNTFTIDTRNYLSDLIEAKQFQIIERIKKNLIHKLKELYAIHLTFDNYNSFLDGILYKVISLKHLDVKLSDFIIYKTFYYAFIKSTLDHIFNDLIFDRSEIVDSNFKFEHDIKKYLTNTLTNSKANDLLKQVTPNSNVNLYKKTIDTIDCPEWMTLEGFYIFNEFLKSITKPNQMQLSFIIKRLIRENHISKDKGYSDALFTYWIMENYNLELTKVRSLKESSSDQTELIYNTIVNNL